MGAAQASLIANYTFPSGGVTSSDTEANSTAGNFSGTAKVLYSSTSESAYFKCSDTPNTADFSTYFTFTVTPGSGFGLNLSTLTFDSICNGTSTTNGNASFFVRSSVDAFASNIGLTFTETYIKSGTSTGTQRSVDLSGATFQNLATATEFRIYVYDNIASSVAYDRIDNVVLNGDVSVIPEPATVGMMGLGALVAMLIRRSV